MQAAHLVDQLVENGVVTETDGGGIELSDEFEADVETHRGSSAGEQRDRTVPRLVSATEEEELAEYSAALDREISRWVPDLPTDGRFRVFLLLDQLYRGAARSEGAPSSFVSIRGDQLGVVFDLVPRAIVYIWLEDCDPCDTVRRDFDQIFPEAPDDLGLFAVYGPEYEDLLRRRYDVVGGPTTLFVRDGEIATRLHKAPHPEVLEHEIEILRE